MLQNAKVGDKVCTRNGYIGVIIRILPDDAHPILVDFPSTDKLLSFTYEGMFSSHNNPTYYDIEKLIPQEQEQTSTPTPSSSVEYLPDLNVHIYHSPNGQSFQIYPQLKDRYVI